MTTSNLEKEMFHSLGSILHRVNEFESYDPELFQRVYDRILPYIKNYANQINVKKIGISKDIVESFFVDKLMFTFLKYHKNLSEDELRYVIIGSLKNYKTKLWKASETSKMGKFNIDSVSFEDIFEKDREDTEEDYEEEKILDISEVEEESSIDTQFNNVQKHLRKVLNQDEYLIWEIDVYGTEEKKKLSMLDIIKFFDLPQNKKSIEMVKGYRNNIKNQMNVFRNKI